MVILGARKKVWTNLRKNKYQLSSIQLSGINLVYFWFCWLKNSSLMTNVYFQFSFFSDHYRLQATRCSFTGRLDSDPDSTVYVSGCWLEKENMDISVMSKKVRDMKTRPSVLVMSNLLRYDFHKTKTKTKKRKILEFSPHGQTPSPLTP